MSDEPKQDQLRDELRRALGTLSDEAQQMASRTCIEGGLDAHRSGISLAETLANLTHARGVLSDALETGKYVQSPLEIQYDLLGHVQALDHELTRLAEGQDALPDLHARVERLNREVWRFRLLDLSAEGGGGFQVTMNRLKSEGDVVRRVAGEFDSLLKNTDRMLDAIAERTTSLTEGRASMAKLHEEPRTIPRQSTETGPQASSLGAHPAQDEAAATQQFVAARQAVADAETVATKSSGMEKEIDAARDMFQKLTEQAQQLLTATESTVKAQRDAEAKKFENFTTSMDARINELVSGVSAQFAKATAAHQVALTTQLQEFTAKSDAAVAGFVAESEVSLDAGDEEFKRLAEHLNELEEQVEEAMRRATGLSLSHAFQRR